MEILTIRLTDWAETNNVLDKSQAGFQKGYSTIYKVFSFHALVQKYLCRDRAEFIAFSLTLNVHSIAYNTQTFGTHVKGTV